MSSNNKETEFISARIPRPLFDLLEQRVDETYGATRTLIIIQSLAALLDPNGKGGRYIEPRAEVPDPPPAPIKALRPQRICDTEECQFSQGGCCTAPHYTERCGRHLTREQWDELPTKEGME